MRNGALKRALGLTLLYLGVFVALVLVQFSRGPGLSVRTDGLSVNATYPKSAKAGSAPESVRLVAAGLAFEISPKNPAESVAPGGASRRLVLAAVDKLPDGVRIRLLPDVELKVSADKGAERRVSLSATAPEGVDAIRIRFTASRSAGFSQADGRLALSVSGSPYSLSMGDSSLDPAAGVLALHPGVSGVAFSRIIPPAPAKPVRGAPEKPAVAQAPKDPAAFKAEVGAWRDKVWSGLSTARLDVDKLAWKGPDASYSFSERALAVYMAEAYARGNYGDAQLRAKAAKQKWADKLGYLTAPYLGGILPKMKAAEAVDLVESKRLAQLASDKSPAVLEKEGFLKFMVDRSPKSLADGTLQYVAGLDVSKITIRQAVGYLGCAIDAAALLKDGSSLFPNAAGAADRLAAAARRTPDGYFLVTEDDGSTDLRLSLLAGEILSNFGASSSKPNLVGVGQSLVEGVLGLSDAQGVSPARALVASGQLSQKSGTLLPEDIYPIVADNPYYPREISFSREIEPGVWAWTCAPSLTVQATASSYVFLAGFSSGRSHFMALYGIKNFKNIQLYDIDYSPDNDFEGYDASGYLYHKDTKSLYLKMRHKKDVEDIKLFF